MALPSSIRRQFRRIVDAFVVNTILIERSYDRACITYASSILSFDIERESMTEEARILIIADNPLVRAGLAAMLDQETLYIAGQIAWSQQVADTLDLTQPDIILANLGWQPEGALTSLAEIAPYAPPVLALMNDGLDASIVATTLSEFRLYGLLRNENDPELLVLAIQAVLGGLTVIEPDLLPSLLPVPITETHLIEELTPREDEVLQLLAQGMTNKAIAHELSITDHTVKFHVNAIMTKLNAQSRTDAVIRATRSGLIIL